MSRPREQILANLEGLYRESFARASESGDEAEKQRLDFEFRRDQLYLEAILDVRELLGRGFGATPAEPGAEPSLTDQLGDLRKLTRFPFGR